MKYILPVFLFASYLGASCLGLYLIKAAETWRTAAFLGGVALYGAGAALWLVILRFYPLSLAFPIAAGGLIICTILTGRVFLHETVSLQQITGAALIIGGIILSVARTHST